MPGEESPSESSPLLAATHSSKQHELVYQRFSTRQKWVILALVSWCGFIPFFVSGIFIPSIPEISKDLGTTSRIISLAVSISIFGASLGGLSWAAYSTFYGRRPIYLLALPLLCTGSFGVGLSQTVSQLMFCRFIQAFGAAPGFAVGAGVIGDIYKLEERGQAMGTFLAACLLGPALAPPVGGFFAQYASWRLLQLSIGVFGCGTFVSTLLFLPETSHPGARGIDKISRDSSKLVFINPLKSLGLLRSPNLLAMSVAGYMTVLTNWVLLIPLAYTIGERYHITNAALIGACFLPAGLGNMIGAPLAGKLSDRAIVKWRAKRGGVWYPEDRLRATVPGAAFLVPLSILFSGLLTRFVPGTIGLVLNLVCLFLNGVGVDIVHTPSSAYAVDIMHDRSAEVIAAISGFRALLLSLSVSVILPAIQTIGPVSVNTISAALAWLGYLILWCTIRYGTTMRAWVDVGFSTSENN